LTGRIALALRFDRLFVRTQSLFFLGEEVGEHHQHAAETDGSSESDSDEVEGLRRFHLDVWVQRSQINNRERGRMELLSEF